MSKASAGTTSASGVIITGDITGDWELQSNGVTKVVMKADGRLYGVALHNNANPITGTTNQYIASGTYTPTLTNAANCSVLAASACTFMRVGNVVTVSGQADVTLTSANVDTAFFMTLPIASDLASANQCAGGAIGLSKGERLAILGDISGNRAQFENTTGWADTPARSFFFTFQYVIL